MPRVGRTNKVAFSGYKMQRGTDTPGGSSQSGGSPSQVELEAYLAKPPLPDGMDVLQWWGMNGITIVIVVDRLHVHLFISQ